MYITGQGFFGLPVLSLILLASYFTQWRLPDNPVIGWVIRLAVWVLLLLVTPQRHFHGQSILFEQDYTNLFGYFCAAELVQRAWTRGRSGRGISAGEALILTALVLAAASNTYWRLHIQILGAAYALCMVPCLRSFSARDLATHRATGRRRKSLLSLRTAAAVLAVMTGVGVVFVVSRYEYWITSWAVQLTRNRSPRGGEIGLSSSPRLAALFNPAKSMQRVLLIDGSVTERHLRAMAFDTYEDSSWQPALENRGFNPIDPATLNKTAAKGQRLSFTRLGNTLDLLLVPANSAAVESPAPIRSRCPGIASAEGLG